MGLLIASLGLCLILMGMPELVLSQSGCLTQSGTTGQCVRAQDCPFVKQLLSVYGADIPDYFRNQLRQMRCNGGRAGAYVCCHINTLTQQVQTKTVRGQSTDINRIDQEGLRLLHSIQECGNKGNPKVAGGRPATQGIFPWMALLKYDIDDPRPFLCSGSLITESHILTAAHCIVERPDVIAVRMGEHNLDTERDCAVLGGTKVVCQEYEDYEVEDVRVHPKYIHGKIHYDIAVIKVKGVIRAKSHIKPICLPIEEKSQALSYNQDFYIAGWGRTDKTDTPSVLQKAIVQRKSLDVCRQFYGDDEVSDNHICAAGTELKHTCQGDSGGPVFIKHRFKSTYRFVQYGIVSFGERRCGQNENQPGLFSNVLDMLPWITQNLQ